MELNQFLRWNPDHFLIEFLWFPWAKWTILRLFYQGVYCAKMCNFLRYFTFSSFYGTSHFFRWNSDHFQIDFLCFYGINGPFWDYFIKGCTVQNWVLLEILLIFDSMGLTQFFEVKFRPLPNQIFMVLYCEKMCIFWDIALVCVCIGLSHFLEVKSRLHPNRSFMFLCCKWYILRLLLTFMLCKKLPFFEIMCVLGFTKNG